MFRINIVVLCIVTINILQLVLKVLFVFDLGALLRVGGLGAQKALDKLLS